MFGACCSPLHSRRRSFLANLHLRIEHAHVTRVLAKPKPLFASLLTPQRLHMALYVCMRANSSSSLFSELQEPNFKHQLDNWT